jgi:putative endonuclease
MFTAYILKSEKTNKYYIGSCEGVDDRLALHNAGRVQSTRSGLPWTLVYEESFNSRSDAWKREFQIKSWKSRSAIEKLVKTKENLMV